ncbi:adaptor protein MecA [Aciduricibacillus chroicocephali]|uniref:Adapter protein MecA n=1 Tax=Aciduricibacillus chroicocephali TaxID=3054939 RepID=A0ABY9KY32_9BACI|nr:adaptor protein MecA [Bacillaceae bacterium 44XB]
MEIERINENTVKFYISYIDIEDRGFEREEIWYDRERSEQLFWQMMDEVNYKEDFNVDGPLWIQVQAMDKGLEITVTKAQLSNNGEDIELPIEHGAADEMTVDEKIENILEEKFGNRHEMEDGSEEGSLSLIAQFIDFEDVIQLSHYFKEDEQNLITKLFAFKDKYFLYVEFPETMSDDKQEDLISQLFEFGDDSDMTIHLLEEYGKVIFDERSLSQVQMYFSA